MIQSIILFLENNQPAEKAFSNNQQAMAQSLSIKNYNPSAGPTPEEVFVFILFLFH